MIEYILWSLLNTANYSLTALILCLALLFPRSGYPQNSPTDTLSATAERTFDPAVLQAFREQPDFQYELSPKPNASFLETLLQQLSGGWSPEMSQSSTGVQIAIGGVILVAVIALLWVLLRLAKVRFPQLLPPSAGKGEVEYSLRKENPEEMPLEALLDQALAQKQFRSAIRLYYLKTLKDLADRKLIHWQADKTNHDYLRELETGTFHEPFAELTRVFEVAWYGETQLDEQGFRDAQQQFTQFAQLVKGGTE